MRWMIYRWWCEGGGDRAWWVIEIVFLCSPDKGSWACLGDLPPDMPRRPETKLGFAMQFKAKTPWLFAQFRQIVPRVTIGLHSPPPPPPERSNVKHSIAGYLRLQRLHQRLHWCGCCIGSAVHTYRYGYYSALFRCTVSRIRPRCNWTLVPSSLLHIPYHILPMESIQCSPHHQVVLQTNLVQSPVTLYNSALQRRKEVSAYLQTEQILPFGFARRDQWHESTRN